MMSDTFGQTYIFEHVRVALNKIIFFRFSPFQHSDGYDAILNINKELKLCQNKSKILEIRATNEIVPVEADNTHSHDSVFTYSTWSGALQSTYKKARALFGAKTVAEYDGGITATLR